MIFLSFAKSFYKDTPTNDVSVRTFYRTERHKNQSVKWLIFVFVKIYCLAEHPSCVSMTQLIGVRTYVKVLYYWESSKDVFLLEQELAYSFQLGSDKNKDKLQTEKEKLK